MRFPRLSGLLALATSVACALGTATSRDLELEDRATGTKYVFAHFIVENSSINHIKLSYILFRLE